MQSIRMTRMTKSLGTVSPLINPLLPKISYEIVERYVTHPLRHNLGSRTREKLSTEQERLMTCRPTQREMMTLKRTAALMSVTMRAKAHSTP
jgi:hypothetical protein